MLLDDGPTLFEPGSVDNGFRDVFRYIAHDPFWYGLEQSETWDIAGSIGDLVFDGFGAWFGTTPGTGRWLFYPTFVGETVNLVYWGHEAGFPIIEIYGPANDPKIVNTTIGITLTFSYSVAVGEKVTIDTQNLTVSNNAGDNLSPYLSGDIACDRDWETSA